MFHSNDTDEITFFKNLDRWMNIVRHMLRRGTVPRGVSDEEYVLLHRKIMQFIDQPESSETSGLSRLRESIRNAVRPWVTLGTLQHCDRRILRLVLDEVGFVHHKMMHRHPLHSRLGHDLIALTVASGLIAMIVFLVSRDGGGVVFVESVEQSWRFVQGIRIRLWTSFTQSSTNQRLIAVATIILVFGAMLVRNSRRF